MGIIRIYGKGKPAKKKAGWEKEQAEHEAWLKKINSMSLFDNKKPTKATAKKINPVVNTTVPTITEDRKKAFALPSKQTTIIGGGVKYVSPEVQYKDDPEMLARELEARKRKFATAPAYNKGGDVLMTDEMMKDVTAGLTRRR